jgi:hypothetical protein
MLQAGKSRVLFPDVIGFFNISNTSSGTMDLGSTQSLTEIIITILLWGKGRPVHKADNLTAICEQIV